MSVIAIIPSLGALGPLALLALIAPALCAALMLWVRRWKAALGAASAMSTAYLLTGWWQKPLAPSWGSTRAGFWAAMATIAALATVWAWKRNLSAAKSERAGSHGSADWAILAVLGAIVVSSIVAMIALGRFIGTPAITLLVLVCAIGVALVHVSRGSCCCSNETAFLSALALGCIAAMGFEQFRAIQSRWLEVVWSYEPAQSGVFLNSPSVGYQNIYIGAALPQEFFSVSRGTIAAIDLRTGRQTWSYDGAGALQAAYPTPCEAFGRLVFGEGLHSDRDCKVRCLELASRRLVWEFPTSSHVESSPAIYAGRVYFGAGDDGLFCVNLADGKKVWNIGGLHIDASPLIVDGVIYIGSYRAADNKFTGLRHLALDAATGREIWNRPANLSCFSKAAFSDGRVYLGLGNGDVESGGLSPAGSVVALNAASGETVWRADLPDAVLATPLIDDDAVIVGCRDGKVYALDRESGAVRWKTPLGAPVIAGVIRADAYSHTPPALMAIAKTGRCVKIETSTGRIVAELDLVALGGGGSGQFIATPTPMPTGEILIAGSLTTGIRETPRLFCLRERR